MAIQYLLLLKTIKVHKKAVFILIINYFQSSHNGVTHNGVTHNGVTHNGVTHAHNGVTHAHNGVRSSIVHVISL